MNVSRRRLFSVAGAALALLLPHAPALGMLAPWVRKPPPGMWPHFDAMMEALAREVSPREFNTWLRWISFQSYDGNLVVVRVPRRFIKNWVIEHYSGVLLKCARAAYYGDVGTVEVLAPSEFLSRARYLAGIRS